MRQEWRYPGCVPVVANSPQRWLPGHSLPSRSALALGLFVLGSHMQAHLLSLCASLCLSVSLLVSLLSLSLPHPRLLILLLFFPSLPA